MPSLYIVATPIGNLEDISPRAIRILREVKLIAAEDTRKTRILLDKYEIKTPLTSYYEHNKIDKLDYILAQLELKDIAIVSEAGMPGISDPGYELVAAAVGRGLTVVPIPGPSAIITALAVSGLATDRFTFIGFLPRRIGERRQVLTTVASETGTIIAYEAPHRIQEALNDIIYVLGDRRIAVCRELTKMYEEVFRGTVSEALNHFSDPRGEFTLVIEGRAKEKPRLTEDVVKKLEALQQEGMGARESVAKVVKETGLSKKEVYQAWLKLLS
ncbi:MAG TPA: 16S rRNA (cytidine(1402)-2'-O)-methyltransferase [Dehalococcoidia bacterium]|jgi:16S rRNA (cytidine1402-2'-O)-methyltransferase|nr:16S rRNA (cytidine(1402)-2'-O)-methyltransferase [Dehalococcoidia bacterium]HAS27702.1 16S rRNA (cytidine(1402)-2'-O)-methyltransferase [Dehalococcoidia bacterium]